MLTECPECRYSLAGLPANHRCPECGFEYYVSMEIYERRRNLKLNLIVVLIGTAFMVLFTSMAVYRFIVASDRYLLVLAVANVALLGHGWYQFGQMRQRPVANYILFGRERIVWRFEYYFRDLRWADVTDVTYSEALAYVRIHLGPWRGHNIPHALIKLIGPGPAVARHFRQLMLDARRAADPQNQPG